MVKIFCSRCPRFWVKGFVSAGQGLLNSELFKYNGRLRDYTLFFPSNLHNLIANRYWVIDNVFTHWAIMQQPVLCIPIKPPWKSVSSLQGRRRLKSYKRFRQYNAECDFAILKHIMKIYLNLLLYEQDRF
jgi:hypothetical protein